MGLKFQPLLFSGFVSSSSGASNPTIGGPITGGTDGSVLFVHPSGIIAQDNANFNFNDTTHALTITGNLSAATFNAYTPENIANKGMANGYAPLDGAAKIPVAFLPSVVMEYQGAWNPSTNTPTLSDGTGTNGYVYYVTAAFAGPIGGLTDPSMYNFQIGDIVIYSSSIGKWQLTTPAAGVQSVNGMQGVVVLTQGNLTDSTAGTDGISVTGGTNSVWGSGTSIAQLQASGSQNGFLASSDWTTFNNKQNQLTPGNISTSSTNLSITGGTSSTVGPNVIITLTVGNLTDSTAGADGISVTNGTGAVLGSGTSIAQLQSSGSQNGYLSSTDWTIFNNKQPAGSYANTNLNNLASPTSINTDLTFSATPASLFNILTPNQTSSNSSSTLNIETGNTDSGSVGSLNINGGSSNSGSAGGIEISSGSSTSGSGGNLYLQAGTGTVNGYVGIYSDAGIYLTPNNGPNPPILYFYEGTSSYTVGLQASSSLVANGPVWSLPTTDGTNGQFLKTNGAGQLSFASAGTVTSVALTTPSFLMVTGSPITTNGTLAVSLTNQSNNTVFAGPSGGGPAAPTFRTLVAADFPSAPVASAGDLNETSFTAAASQTNQPVTGFAFSNAVVRSFKALVSIITSGTNYAEFTLDGIQKASSWEMSSVFIGDSTGYTFSISNLGQVLYTSGTDTATIKFRAITTSV